MHEFGLISSIIHCRRDVIDDEDEKDGPETQVTNANDIKEALETGDVDKIAHVGAQKAGQGLGLLGKMGGKMKNKVFSLWYTKIVNWFFRTPWFYD